MISLRSTYETEIEYLESDGKPLGETDKHRRLILYFIFALDTFFRRKKDVYVSGNLMLYYAEGDSGKVISPDVFLVKGVKKGDRRTYKLWEEKGAPNVVIEISSRKTKRDDFGKKMKIYAELGVKEYYIFDPDYPKNRQAFNAYHLSNEQYIPVFIKDGRVYSHELGLEMVDTGETLRLFNPKTKQFLMTPDEESLARQQAESELVRLRKELARIKQHS
jgi:Uma2 family endonuclease